MRLTVLHVADCPNVALLEQRLDEAFAGSRVDVELTRQLVEDVETAAALGMTGSPTLLVDGTDPFTTPGQTSSVSCRLYRDEDGWLQGAPSVTQLRRALALTTNPDTGTDTGEAGDCCPPPPGASASAALTTWRRRTAPDGPAERAVHQAILRSFAATGRPLPRADLDQLTAAHEASTDQALRRLHDTDVIRLGPDNQIRVAYPFSAMPTRHQVRLAGDVDVYAMCAVDALGMPAMLDVDAVITTADPTSGHPITVTVGDGQSVWEPATAVVFVGAQPGNGPSAQTCCDYLNTFTDHTTAQAWMAAHPHITGEILNHTDAEFLGRRIFGDLLPDHPPPT